VELAGVFSRPSGRDNRPLTSVLQIKNNHHAVHGFLFLRIPFESKLSTGSIKTKTPFGVVVFCLIVELAGVEPASKHGDHMLSTCLVLLDFRDTSAAEQPNMPLVPVGFTVGAERSSG
jgi:hypothetical protein